MTCRRLRSRGVGAARAGGVSRVSPLGDGGLGIRGLGGLESRGCQWVSVLESIGGVAC